MRSINHNHSRSTRNQQPVVSDVCLNACLKLIAQIDRARERVVGEFKPSVQEHAHVLELALNEAQALAWQSGFPHLVFPTLAEENARAVAAWHDRQQRLHDQPHLSYSSTGWNSSAQDNDVQNAAFKP
jgi:hypothetical protein